MKRSDLVNILDIDWNLLVFIIALLGIVVLGVYVMHEINTVNYLAITKQLVR